MKEEEEEHKEEEEADMEGEEGTAFFPLLRNQMMMSYKQGNKGEPSLSWLSDSGERARGECSGGHFIRRDDKQLATDGMPTRLFRHQIYKLQSQR